MKLRAFDGRIVFCVVPRFVPNSYAKTHGEIRCKMAKTDDQPRINWIGVTANACERVGVVDI